MHCFFEEKSFTTLVSLCLFPNMNDDDDDDGDDDDDAGKGTDCGNVFLALLAFFHKLFTFSTLAQVFATKYKKQWVRNNISQ